MDVKIKDVIERFCEDQGLNDLFRNVSQFEDAVDKSVDKAYSGDASRPLTGIGNYKVIKEAALKGVKTKLHEFPNYSGTFDDFHDKCCRTWQDKWPEDVKQKYGSYGTAQKIINMSLKYLYCWATINEPTVLTKKSFSECHMAIDSYTLDWILTQNEETKSVEIEHLKGITNKTKWSKLTDVQYKNIISFLKGLKDSSPYWEKHGVFEELSLLEAEFLIWEYQKVNVFIKSIPATLYMYGNTGFLSDNLIAFHKSLESMTNLRKKLSINDFT